MCLKKTSVCNIFPKTYNVVFWTLNRTSEPSQTGLYNIYVIILAFMDPGTWMSLVHNIWDDEQVMANEVCIQRELCAMNRIAKSVSTDTGLAVSLSR